ncbi:MAG: SRPBCC family protein, partial [Acidobacteriota bacterium]
MAGFSVTRRIDAPVDEVFAVFADFEHAAERIDGIRELDVLTDGPIGAGSRFRETRVMYGKEATEEMEITAFEPDRSYTVECTSHGAHFTSVYTFEPEHGGTNVTLSF